MAYFAQKNSFSLVTALVKAFNLLKREYAAAQSKVHADVTGKAPTGGYDFTSHTQTADIAASATASNLDTAITRYTELAGVYRRHAADDLSHKVADATNAVTAATPSSEPTLVIAVNDLRTQYEAHRQSTTHHYTADSTNTLGAACTDLATAITRLNDEFTKLNAHVQAAPTTPSILIV